ncbi:hypothetical protein TNCV_2442071 [Trichonephila clavipes]|nr:hypothetical protein TNCV_2442071 [Trichonephila clavipes]
MAPHKPRKISPVEYTTDEEDMIVYDKEEEEVEPPKNKYFLSEEYWQNADWKHEPYSHTLIPTRVRNRPNTIARMYDPRFLCDSESSLYPLLTFQAARGLSATDHVFLDHGQVTWTTPELAPPSPNYHTIPTRGRFSSRQI